MRTATKFVEPLTDAQRQQLKEIHKSDLSWRTRMRAQAILLSEKGFALNQLATIFDADRDAVSQWLDWWTEYQFDGLADDPRSGRPPILSTDAKKTKPSSWRWKTLDL
jgi:Helix-turn-helix domain